MSSMLSSILHCIIFVLFGIYGFIFQKNPFDYIFLIVTYITVTHWSFLNGECLVAYLYKKKIDPTYIPGKDLHRNDFDVIYKFSPETMKLIVLLQTIGWGISLYIVLKRCNFDKYMIYSFVLLYFAFYILRISTTDHYKNKTYLILQEIIKYFFLLYGIIFFYILYKRYI